MNRALALALLAAGCGWAFASLDLTWNWDVVWEYRTAFWRGWWTTVGLALAALLGSIAPLAGLAALGDGSSPANSSFAAFTIDTAAATPSLSLEADTGSSNSDRITNNANITVAGLEAGASWEYSSNGGGSWSAGSGSSFTVAAGSYAAGKVQVRQTDLAGNLSFANTSVAAFTVDTTAPSAPVISSAAITSTTTPILSGTAEAGSKIGRAHV